MKMYPKYLFLLAAVTLMFSRVACIESLLEVFGFAFESEMPEEDKATQEMELLNTLWSITQTAAAQATLAAEPTLTLYPTLTPYPTFTAETGLVTITLVSENCTDQYFFADGAWVGFVEAYGTSSFEIKAGEYMLQACTEMEKIHCGNAHLESFTEDTVHRITAHPSCNP